MSAIITLRIYDLSTKFERAIEYSQTLRTLLNHVKFPVTKKKLEKIINKKKYEIQKEIIEGYYRWYLKSVLRDFEINIPDEFCNYDLSIELERIYVGENQPTDKELSEKKIKKGETFKLKTFTLAMLGNSPFMAFPIMEIILTNKEKNFLKVTSPELIKSFQYIEKVDPNKKHKERPIKTSCLDVQQIWEDRNTKIFESETFIFSCKGFI